MDMRSNKVRNVLSHARRTFSQSETSSLLREAGVCKILRTIGGGRQLTENIQIVYSFSERWPKEFGADPKTERMTQRQICSEFGRWAQIIPLFMTFLYIALFFI